MLDSASVLYPMAKARDIRALWPEQQGQVETATVVTKGMAVGNVTKGFTITTSVGLLRSGPTGIFGGISKALPESLEVPAPTQAISAALHANWYELSQSKLSNGAFARLHRLAEKQDGWRGPGSLALHGSSLSSFLRFWRAARDQALEPELMLTPRGTLQAEWYRSHRQFLEIEFIKGHPVANFGLIDTKHRLEGHMPVVEAITFAKNYRGGVALSWSSAS